MAPALPRKTIDGGLSPEIGKIASMSSPARLA
jgi:hypothetical protein